MSRADEGTCGADYQAHPSCNTVALLGVGQDPHLCWRSCAVRTSIAEFCRREGICSELYYRWCGEARSDGPSTALSSQGWRVGSTVNSRLWRREECTCGSSDSDQVLGDQGKRYRNAPCEGSAYDVAAQRAGMG